MLIDENKTVTGQGNQDLDEKVNAAIKKGFQLYGSPYQVAKAGRIFREFSGWVCAKRERAFRVKTLGRA